VNRGKKQRHACLDQVGETTHVAWAMGAVNKFRAEKCPAGRAVRKRARDGLFSEGLATAITRVWCERRVFIDEYSLLIGHCDPAQKQQLNGSTRLGNLLGERRGALVIHSFVERGIVIRKL
jgi:hypothetical protein